MVYYLKRLYLNDSVTSKGKRAVYVQKIFISKEAMDGYEKINFVLCDFSSASDLHGQFLYHRHGGDTKAYRFL